MAISSYIHPAALLKFRSANTMASSGTSARATWVQVLLPCLLLVLVVQVKSQVNFGVCSGLDAEVCAETQAESQDPEYLEVCSAKAGPVTIADAEVCFREFQDLPIGGFTICPVTCADISGGCRQICKSGDTAVMLCGCCTSCFTSSEIVGAVRGFLKSCFPTRDRTKGIAGGTVHFINSNRYATIKLLAP
ncbi:unnamed protein product [Calypogeia fissa]